MYLLAYVLCSIFIILGCIGYTHLAQKSNAEVNNEPTD